MWFASRVVLESGYVLLPSTLIEYALAELSMESSRYYADRRFYGPAFSTTAGTLDDSLPDKVLSLFLVEAFRQGFRMA